MLRALYILTHVASQILYRWLPPPGGEASRLLARVDPQRRAVAAAFALALGPHRENVPHAGWWRDLILATAHASAADGNAADACLPWLPRFLSAYDPTGAQLAKAVATFLEDLREGGAFCVTPVDASYPTLLNDLPDPPAALSVRGGASTLTRPCVSIVGSRKASPQGLQESFDAGRALAGAGFSIVSGGAYGCDIAAHLGVLATHRQPAPAVCVFAGGLSSLYPPGNAGVFRRLERANAVFVSERLYRFPSVPLAFHARNRLIAGLSERTVLIQAAVRSGAMMTARLAADNGRELYVLRPRPDDDARATGNAALLADGAFGYADSAELADLLRPAAPATLPERSVLSARSPGPGAAFTDSSPAGGCYERK